MKSHTELYEDCMRHCLNLARFGKGTVSPNPYVGAVLIKNGKIISYGFHTKFGNPHAEIEAIRNANISLRNATLVVNLEPCSHFGKTPPCVDEIISQNIQRVVIGTRDPNPLVAGKGIAKLRNAGIEVVENILRNKCREFNETYFKYITTNIPFVTLKAAQSLDGFIADTKGNSQWITEKQSRMYVHQLRAEYDAVLVGAKTVLADNPFLTVRMVKGRNPQRVILDGKFQTNSECNIFRIQKKERVFLFVAQQAYNKFPKKVHALQQRSVEVFPLIANKAMHFDLLDVFRILGKNQIASVLVEGGSEVFSECIERNLADKLLLFIAPSMFGNGKKIFRFSQNVLLENAFRFHRYILHKNNSDILVEGYFNK
ncbi:MAG: bifunctional diaminohydroxyphosphoribosylaminopyrimidine deaminase/5-amino-6-(5-phosphoribosylamino)uracil reductase RibD [Ignavibacteria bacterium]|nr:bifunctional diaminohydroxyphosphoribosylaminopyrimidine deaminase/5-amino-6-(5-phosphoribosylamino)uracil reductase RibD [Ignavibacteria bacterium]